MPGIVNSTAPAERVRPPSGRTPVNALFWRLLGLNALVFLVAAMVLLISPGLAGGPSASVLA